jgi:nucleoside diphosphate kinase
MTMVGSLASDCRARAQPPDGVQLTTVREKLELFGFDPYFRDGCDDVRSITESGRKVDLWNSTFVVFRPDAVVTRSVLRGIDLLLGSGFSVLSIYEFQYSHLSVRECWRYQHNINTRDRILAMDLLMTSTPSLLCLLKADCSADSVPASARLKMLKGPSKPEHRKPGQLRYEMGGAQSPMLTFVHAPDEPADLLRELAIFLDPPRRLQAYGLLAREAAPLANEAIIEAVNDIYARTPAHDLEATSVLETLQQRAHAPASLLVDIDRGAPQPLHETLGQLGKDPRFGSLDAVAIATRIDQGHMPGLAPVLPDADPLAWQRAPRAGDRQRSREEQGPRHRSVEERE